MVDPNKTVALDSINQKSEQINTSSIKNGVDGIQDDLDSSLAKYSQQKLQAFGNEVVVELADGQNFTQSFIANSDNKA